MERDAEQIQARAIEWHIRLQGGDAHDWEAFTAWLAEDTSHAKAYDLVEASDLAIEPLLSDIVFREAANDSEIMEEPHPSWRRPWFVGGAVAIASIAVVMLGLPRFATDRYELRTAAGEQRIVALDAGTRVVMNGATTMQFDRDDPRFASLIEGEALFNVRHDASHPFTLHVGDKRIRDAGTVFNVVRAVNEIRVSVSEGTVLYNTDAEDVALDAGHALIDPAGGAQLRMEPVQTDVVGAWQRGRLIYTGQPLAQVAGDLERSLGIRIVIDPVIANRPFSGSITLDGTRSVQIERLRHALDVAITAEPGGWMMKPAVGAQR
jgi:transmembrane sensor